MLRTWDMLGELRNDLCSAARWLTFVNKNRNYMAQDIMRRILRDYFGYEVQFVMNITDVDDKARPSRPERRRELIPSLRSGRSSSELASPISSPSTPPTSSPPPLLSPPPSSLRCKSPGHPTYSRR